MGVWESHGASVETKRKHLRWTDRSLSHRHNYNSSESSTKADICAASPLEDPEEETGLFFWGCVEAAPRFEGRECGVSSVEHRLWEAEQGYEAQMDVRVTSVAPPGWVLSAETLPHTLDGRRQRTKRHSLQSLRKHACFCLSCKRKLGSLSGHAFAFHKAHGVILPCDHVFVLLVRPHYMWHAFVLIIRYYTVQQT